MIQWNLEKLVMEMRAQKARLGYTQDDLARRSGVMQSTISRILSGKGEKPHADTLIKLLTALDMSDKIPLGIGVGITQALPEETMQPSVDLGVDEKMLQRYPWLQMLLLAAKQGDDEMVRMVVQRQAEKFSHPQTGENCANGG